MVVFACISAMPAQFQILTDVHLLNKVQKYLSILVNYNNSIFFGTMKSVPPFGEVQNYSLPNVCQWPGAALFQVTRTDVNALSDSYYFRISSNVTQYKCECSLISEFYRIAMWLSHLTHRVESEAVEEMTQDGGCFMGGIDVASVGQILQFLLLKSAYCRYNLSTAFSCAFYCEYELLLNLVGNRLPSSILNYFSQQSEMLLYMSYSGLAFERVYHFNVLT